MSTPFFILGLGISGALGLEQVADDDLSGHIDDEAS
jgi:hypothetical protein